MTEWNDRELHEMYNEFLDECYGETEIAGYHYQTSRVLKEIDPIAYRCGFSDWLDAQMCDGIIFEHSDGSYHDEEEETEEEEDQA